MDQPYFETCNIVKLKYKSLWIICIVLLAIILVIHVLSYFMIVPQGLILSFLVPLFLFQLLVLMDYNIKSGYESGKHLRSSQLKIHIRPWMVLIVILLIINLFFNFFSNVSFWGVPHMLDGQYALNNHGAYKIVSEEVYRDAVMSEARTFSTIMMVFLFLHFSYFKCRKTRKI